MGTSAKILASALPPADIYQKLLAAQQAQKRVRIELTRGGACTGTVLTLSLTHVSLGVAEPHRDQLSTFGPFPFGEISMVSSPPSTSEPPPAV